MTLPVFVCGSPGVPPEEFLKPLGADVVVRRFPDLGAVAEACQEQLPVAAVLPLTGLGGEGGDTPLLAFLRAYGRQTAVLLYASRVPAEIRRRALAAGAHGVLDVDGPGFAAALRQRLTRLAGAVRRRLEEQQARAVLFADHGVVGQSPAMQEVFRRAIKASQLTDLPVLIQGARGTPRRRLAAAIHSFDPRRSRLPFFALDCHHLPLGLAGPEPTGRGPWPRLLGAAHGGTLFLDHVADLEEPLQRVLLAAAHPARRTTPAAPGAPPVRVIAGTEQPLEEMLAGGKMRPELFDWLNLFRIALPSLRGRPDDVAAQARHALRVAQAGREQVVVDLEPAALEALQRLPWEENTRQVEGLIHEAVAGKARGALLRLEDLPGWVHDALHDPPPPADESARYGAEDGEPEDHEGDEYERRLLLAVLRRHPGLLLGLSRARSAAA
jgi:DNA-binding NtrC family response regulator